MIAIIYPIYRDTYDFDTKKVKKVVYL